MAGGYGFWNTGSGSSGGAAGLLAVTAHDPGSPTDYAPPTTMALVHSSLTAAFTVPASGKVLVRLTAGAYANSSASHIKWGVLEGSTIIGSPAMITQQGFHCAHSRAFLVTGLTPGASKTYGFGHRRDGGVSGSTRYGGNEGQAVIEVWEVP